MLQWKNGRFVAAVVTLAGLAAALGNWGWLTHTWGW